MKIFISVGDISASNYIYEIFKGIHYEFEIYGITDEKLRGIGIRSVADIDDISATGLVEVFPKLKRILEVKRNIENMLNCLDVLIVCDAPGFNIPLIKKAKALGVRKIIYFISPQVWAWKESRIKDIVNYSDHLIVILPFEVNIYKNFENDTFKVHYVGHPLVDIVKVKQDEKCFKATFDIEGDFIGMFPGSRRNEILRMADYYSYIYRSVFFPESIYGVIPTFQRFEQDIKDYFVGFQGIRIIADDYYNFSYEAMKHSRMSLITSGTASLEAFLLGNPHIVFYQTSLLTYMVAKLLIKVRYISLPNIIFGQEIVPELIQVNRNQAIKFVRKRMEDYRWFELVKEQSEELRNILGEKGVILRLRDLFMELIGN